MFKYDSDTHVHNLGNVLCNNHQLYLHTLADHFIRNTCTLASSCISQWQKKKKKTKIQIQVKSLSYCSHKTSTWGKPDGMVWVFPKRLETERLYWVVQKIKNILWVAALVTRTPCREERAEEKVQTQEGYSLSGYQPFLKHSDPAKSKSLRSHFHHLVVWCEH